MKRKPFLELRIKQRFKNQLFNLNIGLQVLEQIHKITDQLLDSGSILPGKTNNIYSTHKIEVIECK